MHLARPAARALSHQRRKARRSLSTAFVAGVRSGENPMKLYCSKCQELYDYNVPGGNYIDGAFFGTTFPHLFMQTFHELRPTPSTAQYIPRVFGFRVHKSSVIRRLNRRALVENEPEDGAGSAMVAATAADTAATASAASAGAAGPARPAPWAARLACRGMNTLVQSRRRSSSRTRISCGVLMLASLRCAGSCHVRGGCHIRKLSLEGYHIWGKLLSLSHIRKLSRAGYHICTRRLSLRTS